MLVTFEGIRLPIALANSEELLRYFEAVLHGWRFEEASSTNAAPVIIIHGEDRGYRLESPWLDGPVHAQTEVDAVCAFIVELVKARVAEDPSLLCLHCGAAVFGGRLVVFPSRYRAGKSTLVTRIAAAGRRVFADDVLMIASATGEAIALGVAPRLRLPLPDTAGHLFHRYVEAHRGPGNGRYLYLNVPSDRLARYGQTAPVGAFVLLDRRPTGAARLLAVPKSQGLKHAIAQNFARAIAASGIVGSLRSLIDRSPCFILRYADLDEAAAALTSAFSEWPPEDLAHATPASPSSIPPNAADKAQELRRRGRAKRMRLMRDPAIESHILDQSAFLIDPRSQSIYHLNPVASGLWRLLSQPIAEAEAVNILCGAFPEVDRRRIASDVKGVLAAMLANRLVLSQALSNERSRTSVSGGEVWVPPEEERQI